MKRRHSLRDSYQAKLRKEIAEGIERRAGLKRTELARKSAKQRKRESDYSKASKAFLARPENKWCRICIVRGLTPNPATETHHLFGRNGSLLCDERGFCPSCFSCRMWPHENGREARRLGVLGDAVNWGVPIDRHRKIEKDACQE